MNKQQLASKIWASANKMRSKIEANEYKDYILGFIFYKFLSDKEVTYLTKELGWKPEELPHLVEEEEPETVNELRDRLGYFIGYKDLFSTWIDPAQTFTVGDVRDALIRFARLISPLHEKVYKGIFDTLQNGLSKLGDSTGAQTRAIADLLALIKDIPTDGSQDYDVLGFIYEYLIGNFAANAGKKAGEFYTPHEVGVLMSEIVAHHLRDRKEPVTIYDPTSGSGSLLLNIGRSVAKYFQDPNMITYYAQELKEPTYNLTRMNLVMRGILPNNIVVRNADTLEQDWPMMDEQGMYSPLYCDAVVSNPPYSQEWSPTDSSQMDARYRDFGVAPKGTADYAFLLHDLYHVKPDGIMTIVLPHGVLFRGGVEEQIRTRLVERNHIDAIIGLPGNIFFGTGIPTLVMVLKQQREHDEIMIVDASRGYAKEGTNNKLRARDIRKIVDAVTERREIPGYSCKVSRETVRKNGYNLNIPRYVSAAEAETPWDLCATMQGGIPNSEIAALAPFWTAFPELRAQLWAPVKGSSAYSDCRYEGSEQVREAIMGSEQVQDYVQRYRQAIGELDASWSYVLVDGLHQPHEQHDFEAIAQQLLRVVQPFHLIDPYAAYEILSGAWGTIAADLEMLDTEGQEAARRVDPNMVVKKKDGKDVEVQDGWVGHILPLELVQRQLMSQELAQLEQQRAQREQTVARLADIIAELPDDGSARPWLNKDGTALVPKELKSHLKAHSDDHTPLLESLRKAQNCLNQAAKLRTAITKAEAQLTQATIERMDTLTHAEVKMLLHEKWIPPLISSLLDLADQEITHRLTTAVTALTEKYAETLAHIDAQVTESQKALSQLMSQLRGNKYDMEALKALQAMLTRHE